MSCHGWAADAKMPSHATSTRMRGVVNEWTHKSRNLKAEQTKHPKEARAYKFAVLVLKTVKRFICNNFS